MFFSFTAASAIVRLFVDASWFPLIYRPASTQIPGNGQRVQRALLYHLQGSIVSRCSLIRSILRTLRNPSRNFAVPAFCTAIMMLVLGFEGSFFLNFPDIVLTLLACSGHSSSVLSYMAPDNERIPAGRQTYIYPHGYSGGNIQPVFCHHTLVRVLTFNE